MARADRCTIGHVYQPTAPRRAYGRRNGSRVLIEDLPRFVRVLSARQDASAHEVPGDVRRLAIPMPRGGARWVLICPTCQRHVTRLYGLSRRYRCRKCWGLAYASQYAGRRPEAAPERIVALRRSARHATLPETRRRRHAQARAARRERLARAELHDYQRRLAFAIGVLPLLIRERKQQEARWERLLQVALRESRESRVLIADCPAVPPFIADALRRSLDSWQSVADRAAAQSAAKAARRSARRAQREEEARKAESQAVAGVKPSVRATWPNADVVNYGMLRALRRLYAELRRQAARSDSKPSKWLALRVQRRTMR